MGYRRRRRLRSGPRHAFTLRIVDVDRIAAACDRFRRPPAFRHILDLQRDLTVHPPRFADTDLRSDLGNGRPLESRELAFHKVGNHQHLPPPDFFRLRQMLHVRAVQPLQAGHIHQHLVLLRTGKEQHLVAVESAARPLSNACRSPAPRTTAGSAARRSASCGKIRPDAPTYTASRQRDQRRASGTSSSSAASAGPLPAPAGRALRTKFSLRAPRP